MKDYLSPVMIRTVCSSESDVWSWWSSVYTDWGLLSCVLTYMCPVANVMLTLVSFGLLE